MFKKSEVLKILDAQFRKEFAIGIGLISHSIKKLR